MAKRVLFIAWILVLLVPLQVRAQEKLDIPFVPSPMVVVHRMLKLAEIKKDDIVYDLGSGDGRIIIEAAKKYGSRGVGIDLNPELVETARANAAKEGVSHLVEFRAGDALAACGRSLSHIFLSTKLSIFA